MSFENDKLTINSTWTANEESVSLKDIISFEDVDESDWMQLSEEDINQLDHWEGDDSFSPLQLTRQNENEPCMLTINLEDPCFKITKLIVISEAKILEFYGKHGEYMCTIKAHLLGDIAGKEFYIAQPKICGTKEITLKFCEKRDILWLYGITLFVDRIKQTPYNSMIDFVNVEQMLQSSNVHLTENAERAKTFIANFNSAKSNNGQNDSDTLQNLLKKWSTLGLNTNPLLSKLSSTPILSNLNQDNLLNKENGNKEDPEDFDLKDYVDKKLQQLEEKVQHNLQLQLKEFEQKQNKKLDNIIELLQRK